MKDRMLIVVDENRMGGVSILLEDILSTISFDNYIIDLMVLSDSGDRLKNVEINGNIIYGDSYFSVIDITLKEAIFTFNPLIILKRLKLILDMKTGIIGKTIVKKRKKLLKYDYDVEIAFKDGFTALFTSFGSSKKKIHWLHYDYGLANPNRRYQKLFVVELKKFDKIVSVSKYIMEQFLSFYGDDFDIEVIPNLVNTERIIEMSKEVQSKPILNKKGIFKFISVGRLHHVKGYDRLIKAISQLENKNSFTLDIYGDGPDLLKLEKLIWRYKLNDVIFLRGSTNNPYNKMSEADMFILPSRYESFGLVIVEAMLNGIPVMATNNAATAELISDSVGLVVENSLVGLNKGLCYILENENRVSEMKSNLKKYSYDNNEIIKKIKRVVNEK